jgi:hypothetical protein
MQIISIIADLLTVIVFFVSGIAWIIGKLKFLQNYPLISQISLGLLVLILVVIMIRVVMKYLVEVVYSLGLAEQKRQLSATLYHIDHSKPMDYAKVIPKELVLREFTKNIMLQAKKFANDVKVTQFRYWSIVDKPGKISQSVEVVLYSKEKQIKYTYSTDDFSLNHIKEAYPSDMNHVTQFSSQLPFYETSHWRDAIVRSLKHCEYDHYDKSYYLSVINMGGEIHISISLRNIRVGKSHTYVLKNNIIEYRDGKEIITIHEYKS